MDTLAVVGEVVRQVALPAAEESVKFQINLFWIIVAAANFVVFFLIVQRIRVRGPREDPQRPAGPHRAGPQGRRAGATRSRSRPSRSGRRPSRRPGARPTRSSTEPRRSRRSPASRRLPPPARRSPGCANARRARSTRSGSGRGGAPRRGHRPRAAGRQPRRRRVDDRGAPAQARGRVPRGPLGRRFRRLTANADGARLMARQTTAARRYAEAAFEVALRDDELDGWRDDLVLAADMLGRPEVEPVVDSPAIPQGPAPGGRGQAAQRPDPARSPPAREPARRARPRPRPRARAATSTSAS